MWDHMSNIA